MSNIKDKLSLFIPWVHVVDYIRGKDNYDKVAINLWYSLILTAGLTVYGARMYDAHHTNTARMASQSNGISAIRNDASNLERKALQSK